MIADLHLHTCASDGELTPYSLVSTAKALKIPIIAITDHDNINGIDEAMDTGKIKGIQVIPGVELSSYSDREVHMLGYNIDYKSKEFNQSLADFQNRRLNRNLEIIDNLNKKGIRIEYSEIDRKGTSIGRMHIARLMLKKGYVISIPEAFDRYLGIEGCCYVQSRYISPREAIELIISSGGVPVLAHPYRYVEEGHIQEFIQQLDGLQGIETWYPQHTPKIIEEIIRVADYYDLITTGGSDFHSPHHGSPMGAGNYRIDDKTRERLGIH